MKEYVGRCARARGMLDNGWGKSFFFLEDSGVVGLSLFVHVQRFSYFQSASGRLVGINAATIIERDRGAAMCQIRMSWILNWDAIGIEKEKALADFVNSFFFSFKCPGGLLRL